MGRKVLRHTDAVDHLPDRGWLDSCGATLDRESAYPRSLARHPDLFILAGRLRGSGSRPLHKPKLIAKTGTLSNQTNLAVKAIVGIGAMGELAKATGHWVDSIHYRATAKAYAEEWYQLALTAKDPLHPHAKLAYQDENSHGILCEASFSIDCKPPLTATT